MCSSVSSNAKGSGSWYVLSFEHKAIERTEGDFVSSLSDKDWRSYMYRSQERFMDRRQWCQWAEFMETLYRAPKTEWAQAQVVSQPMTAEERLRWDMEQEPWKYGAESPEEDDRNDALEEDLRWDEVEAYLQTYED
jgi:hypothetical protein